MPVDFREIDPRELRLPSSRPQGADPGKLQRQIANFGASRLGMPPIWVYEASDGVLLIYDGVTRATRIAKLSPGTTVPIEIIGQIPLSLTSWRKIGEVLP